MVDSDWFRDHFHYIIDQAQIQTRSIRRGWLIVIVVAFQPKVIPDKQKKTVLVGRVHNISIEITDDNFSGDCLVSHPRKVVSDKVLDVCFGCFRAEVICED